MLKFATNLAKKSSRDLTLKRSPELTLKSSPPADLTLKVSSDLTLRGSSCVRSDAETFTDLCMDEVTPTSTPEAEIIDLTDSQIWQERVIIFFNICSVLKLIPDI